MAYESDTYAGGHVAATDLQRIENNFAYLRVSFRSGAAPADPGGLLAGLEGVVWWDSSGGANPSTSGVLRVRDDSDWRAVFTGSAAFKIWAYLDAAENGWVRDSSMKDQVLALKSDAGDYVTGATKDKGSWIVTSLTKDPHTHAVGTLLGPNHAHRSYEATPNSESDEMGGVDVTGGSTKLGDASKGIAVAGGASGTILNKDYDTDLSGTQPVTGDTGDQSTGGISSGGLWRIRASVGILVGPDI